MNGPTHPRRAPLTVFAIAALLVTSCTVSGVDQKEYDRLVAQVAQLQQQVKSMAPTTIVQAGELQAAAPQERTSDWETEAAERYHVKLIATYDSSGPDAWNPAQHPLVFITSEGKGYAGTYSQTYKLAGLQMIDGNTRQHVASAAFDLGFRLMGTPHGLAVSADGRWIYVPTGDGEQPWSASKGGGRLLVVNARTLKIDRVVGSEEGPHHVRGFRDWQGRSRVLVEAGAARFILDPDDDHRVVASFGPLELNGLAYQSYVDPSGKYVYSGIVLGERPSAERGLGAVAKMDLETGRVRFISGVGMYPNGFAFTADGKYTYVADSAGSRVYKIDNESNSVLATSQTAVPGPYNISLNWDESELWVVGKGELSYNLGGSLGLVNTRLFQAVRDYPIGGQTIDHIVLHPSRDANEIWVTSSGTLETIIFDLGKREVTRRIPAANGGDTHSGVFVRYQPSFTGELLADAGGFHNSALAAQQTRMGVAPRALQDTAAGSSEASAVAPTPQPGVPPTSSTDRVARGKLVFDKTAAGVGCQFCHGLDGRGRAEFASPDIRGKTADDVRSALQTRAQMSAVKLNEQEIDAVAAYLQALPR